MKADGPAALRAETTSLTARVLNRLQSEIISGILAPGEKLKIDILRTRYDVGATPIREALSLLTSRHLVKRIDQRGFIVAPVSLEDFDELLTTRCWLEERAITESIANGDDRWIEEIVIATYRLSRADRPNETGGDDDAWEALHKAFHMKLISKSGSRYLFDLCEQLYDQNIRYRKISRNENAPQRSVQDEHEAIADAVMSRNAPLAASLLQSHYRRTGDLLRQTLSKQFDAGAAAAPISAG